MIVIASCSYLYPVCRLAREAISPLALEDIKKWGNRVLEEAKKEIWQFYPAI